MHLLSLLNKYPYILWRNKLATYPIINKQTGEQKEVTLSVHDWDNWKNENPEWERDWSDPSTCPSSGEIGEVYDKLKKSHPGWNDVLHKASKAPGSRVKPI
jgi:thymidylate synthase